VRQLFPPLRPLREPPIVQREEREFFMGVCEFRHATREAYRESLPRRDKEVSGGRKSRARNEFQGGSREVDGGRG